MRTFFVDYENTDNPGRFEIHLGITPAEESPFNHDMFLLKTSTGEVSFPVHMLSLVVHTLLSEAEKEYDIPFSTFREVKKPALQHLRFNQPEPGVCDGVVTYCEKDAWLNDTETEGISIFTHEHVNSSNDRAKGLVHIETCLLALLLNRFYIDEKHIPKS